LGLAGGPALTGTPCDDGDPATVFDTWDAACACAGYDSTTLVLDCLGQPFGPNVPGSPCIDQLNLMLPFGTWSTNCQCVPDSSQLGVDCLGVIGGSNHPGGNCDDGDASTPFDYWDNTCTCVGYPATPCQAGFEVLPSAPDTTGGQPITLWIINTSFGGSGAFTYLWDFGDGFTSTDFFPTHDYAGFGPYNLCLTMDDGNGCTDTYCDSIGLDSNGFFRNSFTGFTLSVMQGATGNEEIVAEEQELNLWPNPARDELNIAFTRPMQGVVELSIMDLEGRVVRNERLSGASGMRTLPLDGLANGIYLLRATSGSDQFTERFVKTD
jgi:hypothetical protein